MIAKLPGNLADEGEKQFNMNFGPQCGILGGATEPSLGQKANISLFSIEFGIDEKSVNQPMG